MNIIHNSSSFVPVVIQLPAIIAQSDMVHHMISTPSSTAHFYLFHHVLSNSTTFYLPLLEFLDLITTLLPASKLLINNKKRHLYRRPLIEGLRIFATYQRNIVVKVKTRINLYNCEFLSCREIQHILQDWKFQEIYLQDPACQCIDDFLQHFHMGYIQAKALAWLMLFSNLFI